MSVFVKNKESNEKTMENINALVLTCMLHVTLNSIIFTQKYIFFSKIILKIQFPHISDISRHMKAHTACYRLVLLTPSEKTLMWRYKNFYF